MQVETQFSLTKFILGALACMFAMISLPTVSTAQNDSIRDAYYNIDGCVVNLIPGGVIEVPALESGQLVNVATKRGGNVKQGMLVAQVDDRVARRMLEQAQHKLEVYAKRAADNTEINLALRKYKLAKDEYEDQNRLYQKRSTSKQKRDRAQYSMEVALLEHQMAKNTKTLAEVERLAEAVNIKAALDSIERHAIASKADGIVFEVYKHTGEWVTAGEKVMKVARMDVLHVQGTVMSKEVDPHEVKDKPVTITVEMARGRKIEFQGRIVHVGNEKIGRERFQVVAEVQNRFENNMWTLQAGSEANMKINLQGQGVAGPVGQNPAGFQR